MKNVTFHFHNTYYHFCYSNSNHLSRLLIDLAYTPTFLTIVLGDSEFVCLYLHMEIFASCQYSFSTFPINFKEITKMNDFIFITDIRHILTCLHMKVVLLTIATFFKYAMNHCIPFPFSCTIATILPSAVSLDFSEDGTRGHTLEFYISSRREEKKDI